MIIKPHRGQPLWIAFLLHRISGVGLAIFLPFHFYLLGLALEQSETMDGLLRWSDYPLVKFAEFGLVFLLAVHMFGGLRLLALEFLPWRGVRKRWIGWGAGVAVAAGLLFVVSVR
jgi:fumarate reductase subunit D